MSSANLLEHNYVNQIKQWMTVIMDTVSDFINHCFEYCRPLETLKMNGHSYTVQKRLGEGGFSYVYLVQAANSSSHPHTNKLFALKRIRIQLPEHEEEVLSEIRSHQAVHSPRIIELVDHEFLKGPDGRVSEGLLLLPFFGNGTLQDLIEKEAIGFDKIIQMSLEICEGLLAFHSHIPPLAYRDLKPANILINDFGECVLMDLGSVTNARVRITSRKDALALQEKCAQTVTAPFRPPELFDPPTNRVIDERTDIWSLGCTIYAMVTGESPFDGSATSSVGGKVTYKNGFDERLQSLINWLLTEHDKRPTAQQVLTRLKAF